VLLGLVDGVGDGLADGLDVGLTDGDACGLVLALVLALADELGLRDDPPDGLPPEGECPEDAGVPAPPPVLPAAGALPWLPPDLAEPPPADLFAVDPPAAPDIPGCEEFSACGVCVWE